MKFTTWRKWWKQSCTVPQARRAKKPGLYRPLLEVLEDRTLLSVSLIGVPPWRPEGPAPIVSTNNVTSLPTSNSVGSVQSVVVARVPLPDGSTENIVYVGTVNGGVWKTTDITDAMATGSQGPTSIHWTPVTDQMPSLATGAMALDPNDPNGGNLWVGTGSFSSFAGFGGPPAGLLHTSDGGQTWSVLGKQFAGTARILSVVPTTFTETSTGPIPNTGQVVLVAAVDQNSGVYRSIDGGVRFQLVNNQDTGTPLSGNAFDLVEDPNDPTRFFAALAGQGVYESTDKGKNWSNIDGGIVPSAGANNIHFAIQAYGTTTVLYAAVTDNKPVSSLLGVYRAVVPASGPPAWQSVAPATLPIGYNINGGGGGMLSVAADPNDPNIVYLGYGYRGDASAGGVWSLYIPVNNTYPHADTRHVAFLNNTTLLETDDGGLYSLANPRSVGQPGYSGNWVTLNGDLQNTEFFSVAFDSAKEVIIGGTQDNGSPVQSAPGSTQWGILPNGVGDGGLVAADSNGVHYYFANAGFYRDSAVVQLANQSGGLIHGGLNPVDKARADTGAFSSAYPFIINPADASRLLIGLTGLYESTTQGDVITAVTPSDSSGASLMSGKVTTMAYGVDQPIAAYVGTSAGQLFLRSSAGGAFSRITTPNPGAFAVRIVVDPDEYRIAYVLDSTGKVWQTTDAGSNWIDLTDNLDGLAPSLRVIQLQVNRIPVNSPVQDIELYDPTPGSQPGDCVLLAACLGGVYRRLEGPAGLSWTQYGAGLPNVLVTDLHSVRSGLGGISNFLLAGTLGRGAWTISAGDVTTPGQLVINGDGRDDILTLNASSSGTQIDLNGQASFYGPLPLSSISIKLGGGTNTINLEGTAPNIPVYISGGGTETVNIGTGLFLSNILGIQGAVSIESPLGAQTTININDSGDDRTPQDFILGTNPFNTVWGYVHASKLPNFNINYSYNDTSSLRLDTGTAPGNFINVYESGVPTNLFSHADAIVRVGNGNIGVQGIFGAVTINNPSGVTDLTVDNRPNANSHAGVLISDNSITYLAQAPINYQQSPLRSLTVYGGDGNNTFDVSDLSMAATLVGGAGYDRLVSTNDVDFYSGDTFLDRVISIPNFIVFSLGRVTLSGIESTILTGGASANRFEVSGMTEYTLDGRDGSDTYVVNLDRPSLTVINDTGSFGSNKLIVNDADNNSAGSSTYDLTANEFMRTDTPFFVGPIYIHYVASLTFSPMAAVTVNTGHAVEAPNAINVLSTGIGTAATINTGDGVNQINVRGSGPGSTTTIHAGTGTDTVTVTESILNLNALQGPVVVQGNGGTTLILDDRANQPTNIPPTLYLPWRTSYLISSQSLTRTSSTLINSLLTPSHASLSYANLANLIVYDGTVPDTTFDVLSTAGANQVVLHLTGQEAVHVGDASTNLDGIGNLVVEGDSGTTLILDDRANKLRSSPFNYYVPLAASYVISDQNVARTSVTDIISLLSGRVNESHQASLTYHNIASLSLYGGSSGAEKINVIGTSANIPVTVYAGPGLTGLGLPGTNTVNVGSNALIPASSMLDLVAGPLSVIGQGSTALNLNDQGRTAAQGYAFLADGNDAGNFYRGFGRPVYFGNVASVTLHGGSGGNTINVFGTPANIPVTVYTGAGLTGSNTVNVGSNILNPSSSILDLVAGPLSVIGQGSTMLNINDQGTTADKTYNVTDAEFTRSSWQQRAVITERIAYSRLGSLAVHGGSGNDQFFASAGVLAGTITTVAGNGSFGYSGDGRSATAAMLATPIGVAVDAAGNLFIADTYNHVIRKVSPAGIITTVAGNGSEGYSGDGGAASAAQLDYPFAVAVAAAGDLFIADTVNNVIRKVRAGIITTVAGNGARGYSGDGGAATAAKLFGPSGVAVDAAGNLFIADGLNNVIREVRAGIITTVAGNGSQGYSGDGGAATAAQLADPAGVAVDAAGNLFIADYINNVIREVSPAGIITTVAGNGTPGYRGDNGPATAATLNSPTAVAVDAAGNLFIVDFLNQVIRGVSPAGIITTVAGNGSQGYSGDGGAATAAQLADPAGVAVDAAGDLFIVDSSNSVIRKVTPSLLVTPPSTTTAGPLTLDGGGGNNTFTGSFAGTFDQTLALANFSAATLSVQGDFSGSFLAPTVGTSTQPMQQIQVGGSVTSSAKIKVNYLSTLSVGGDLAGTVKGFGDSGSQSLPTIGTVTVGGDITSTGSISAPVLGSITQKNLAGTIRETNPTLDMASLSIDGSLTATGQVFAASIGTMTVGLDLAGQVMVSGPLRSLNVAGSLAGKVAAGSLNALSVGQDLTGLVTVAQTLGTVSVGGSSSGVIDAGQVNTLSGSKAHGPLVLDIKQGGVERRLQVVPAGPPSTESSLDAVSFAYLYDATGGGAPRLTVHVSNPDPIHKRFDLSLLSSNANADFNLAQLDAPAGPAGIRDIVIDGDLMPGAIQLPKDHLGSVAAWGNAAAGAIQAASIEAVAFGSLTSKGKTVSAGAAGAAGAARLLAPHTGLAQASDTFQVPFGEARPVALFLVMQPREGEFDDDKVLFTDQLRNGSSVTALVTVTAEHRSRKHDAESRVQTIALQGDGGAIRTELPIFSAITSTGPLGDLILQGEEGLAADVTAPTIIGNIDVPNGPLSGTIQTTAGDLGRTVTDAAGQILGTTTIHVGGGPLSGRIISRGNLLSRVIADDKISGVIAAQGDIGAVQRDAQGRAVQDASGHLTRFGGVESGDRFSGELVALGNVFGDLRFQDGLRGGRIAVKGRAVAGLDPSRTGILGNIIIDGNMDRTSVIVSAGMIGDAAGGTVLDVHNIEGIVAATGPINLGKEAKTKRAAFFAANLGAKPGDPSAAAIDALFQSGFDVGALDLGGLDLILRDLASLRVSNGHLSGAKP